MHGLKIECSASLPWYGRHAGLTVCDLDSGLSKRLNSDSQSLPLPSCVKCWWLASKMLSNIIIDQQPIQGELEIWNQLMFLRDHCRRGQKVLNSYSLVQTDAKHSWKTFGTGHVYWCAHETGTLENSISAMIRWLVFNNLFAIQALIWTVLHGIFLGGTQDRWCSGSC